MVFMHSSTSLISSANSFLDECKAGKSEKNAGKKEKQLLENVSKLEGIRTEMLHAGFNSPFLGLLASTRQEVEEASEEESQDLAKQIEKIQNLARMKKYSLNRVRVALAAHKSALGIISNGFQAQMLEELPLDGNYISTLVSTREPGLHAYKMLMNLLETNAETSKTMFVTIEFEEKGEKRQKTFKLASAKNIEEKIKRDFGANAKIVSTRVGKSSDALVRKRSARACLSAAYAATAFKLASTNAVRRSKLLGEYAKLMAENGLDANARIDAVEGLESVKRKMHANKLADYEGEEFVLKEELKHEMAREKAVLRDVCERKAKKMLATDLFNYFMLFPKKEREKGTVFPSLNASVSREKLEFVNNALKETLEVEDAAGIIMRKIEAEKLALKLDSKSFGAAFAYLNTPKNIEWCAQHFGVDEGKIRGAAAILAQHVEAPQAKLAELGVSKSGKAKKFSELMRDA
ncbi:DUF530 family protein [Candidatus Micrarchaeota archaeon]|nr:DUF530 family protein [Candidatus Micrarchaeota archaeon]